MEISGIKTKKSERVGGLLTISGLIILILTLLLGKKEGFWSIYTTGSLVAGITVLGIGLMILILSILQTRTSILDLKERIDAGRFGIILAVSTVAIIIITAVVIPHFPKTDITKLPPNPKLRNHAQQIEYNFRAFFALSLIVAGISISSIPTIKFFKN